MAFELRYASESAFSTAFRREVGCSPRAYRQAALPSLPSHRHADHPARRHDPA
ncbi:MAG: AraC family transcriptional regulator [Archangiaceae bacterium]|nr:AraC family transcriptional regulator [Archangiaceae bacterium]